jgi:hypothetical protein
VLSRQDVSERVAERALPVAAVLPGEEGRAWTRPAAALKPRFRFALLDPVLGRERERDFVNVFPECPSSEGVEVLAFVNLEYARRRFLDKQDRVNLTTFAWGHNVRQVSIFELAVKRAD